MSLDYKFVTLGAWPKPFTRDRKLAQFTSSATGKRTPLATTLRDLEREVRMLSGRNVIIQVALKESDIRRDGQIRSTARLPEHPGVIVAFDDPSGPLSFAQDRYLHWHDNLRAIALTLQALRTVDRYGVTQHGEQYQGFRALPAASVPSPPSDRYEAAKTLVFFSCIHTDPQDLLKDLALARTHWIAATKKAHPDNGGTSEAAIAVQQAWETLQK